MQVKQISQDGLSHKMEITLAANDIDARVEARLIEVGKTLRRPGFRPGKVPLAILKKQYGKAVMGEVLEQAVNETSQKALQDKGLRPAVQPKIEVKSFDEGKDLTYTMSVEVLPEIALADFKGLKLEKPVVKPDEKAVMDALERIAQSRRQTKPVEGKRAAKEGDTVVIDFHGRTADDNKAHEGMHAHGHHLELGSGQFIPGFEGQLVGRTAGDKAEVRVTFPENYGAKELAGREAIFDVEIKELREPSDVKVDENFAKSMGAKDLETLKKAAAEQLQREFDQNARLVMKKSLLDALDALHDFEVPPGMLEMEHGNILEQIEMDRRRNPQAESAELSEEEKAELREISARRVRLGLVLSEIGRRNNLSVGDQDLQKAVIAEAQKYPGQERQVFDYYAKNRRALESLRAPLFEEKVVDFIIALADVTEKSVTPEDLFAALEDEEDAAPAKSKKESGKKAGAKSGAKKDGQPKGEDAKGGKAKPAAKKKA